MQRLPLADRSPAGPVKPWARAVLWGACALVLAAVAVAYLDPHLMVDLATRFWSCW